MSTTRAKRGCCSRSRASAARSRARGVVVAGRRGRSGSRSSCRRARALRRARSSPRRSASREPEMPSASVSAASLALSSMSASSRSLTRMRSPGRRLICDSTGRAGGTARGEHLARPGALERQQRGHQLRGAGDRAARVRALGEHHLAVAAVDDDRRRRVRHGGRRGPRRCACAGGQRAAASASSSVAAAPHSRSLIFWPTTSSCGSRSGLSSWSRSTGTPVFSEISPRVSPSLTV